ncbi:MAG: aminotransferase class IV [Planctomycetota bacterium]
MTPTIYFNGEFRPADDAHVSVQDGGWLHGAGLFETMRAEGGRVFRLESHMARLMQSAAKLLRPIGREDLPSRVDFLDLLERNELKVARVRMTVSAGPMTGVEPAAQTTDAVRARTPARRDLHSAATADPTKATVCASASPLSPPPAQTYETGVRVVICDYRQSPSDPLAGHKTTAYLGRLLALRDAQRARCMEALWFTTASLLAEGSISNVFIVKKDVLKTPPLDTPVLPGIARGIVLDIARDAKIETRQCPLTIDDLLEADELLLTNSIMQVMPVIRVEKRDIAGGRVGPVAKRLLEAYRQLVRKECAAE